MPLALEVVSGRAVNPAALTALTANTGSSFTVRAAAEGSRILLLEVWTQQATAGEFRVRSARMHDQSDGIRLREVAARVNFDLPDAVTQDMYSQDALTVEIQGGGAETDTGFLLIFYQDLPGIAANLAAWSDIAPRIKNLIGVRENGTASATAGDVSQFQALNADQDTFKRNVNYAFLGAQADVNVGLLGLVGADTGNMIIGVPSDTATMNGPYALVELSQALNLPLLPIINGANIPATNAVACHTTASQAINANFIFAELA